MKRFFFTVLVFCLAFPLSASAVEPTFIQKVRTVLPGMTRDDVSSRLGEPAAVLQRGYDINGNEVEIWRYFPGSAAPPSHAAIAAPAPSAAPDARSDEDFWRGVQKAAITNPADAGYKPVFAKASRPATTELKRIETYQVLFVNGVVENVQLVEL